MKNETWIMAAIVMSLCLLVMAGATPANGQTMARFNVPFQFVAGDQVLPAGEYRVTVEQGLRRIDLRQVGGDEGAGLAAIPAQLERAVNAGTLVFNVYGSVRVLQAMRIGGRTEGIELPLSKAAREMARAGAPDLMAKAPVELVSAQ